MRQTIKAVLLSALVFPGSGHLMLKKPVQGTVLIAVVIFCLYYIVSTVLEMSQKLSAQIQSGEVTMDANQISDLVTQQLEAGSAQAINIPIIILAICWLLSIADSYRLGKKQDEIDKLKNTNTL